MSLIEEFISRYRRELDYYEQAARLAAQQLEAAVQAAGIRGMVTFRAKSPIRLEAKIRQRETTKQYNTLDEIALDIVDLAGVRLALYFPGDRQEVDRIVRGNFDLLEDPKIFPVPDAPSYAKRFSGYWATHYRVRLRDASLPDSQKRYAEARIEIQVASVLMHAWAEVEHDLVYKPVEGNLSADEYAILDELNGLVIAGEIALERLQRAIERRVSERGRRFENHYDLAAFLFDVAQPLLNRAPTDSTLGRIDLLYALLDRLGLATPDGLAPFIRSLDPDLERRPIADQIIDQVISADPRRYEVYQSLREQAETETAGVKPERPESLRSAIGSFMASWIEFERLLRQRQGRVQREGGPYMAPGRVLSRLGFADERLLFELERLRRIRNNLVHGVEIPDPDTLFTASRVIDELAARIKEAGPVDDVL